MADDTPPRARSAKTVLASLQTTLDAQRRSFLANMPVSLATRQDRLDRAAAMLLKHREALLAAVLADFPARGSEWSLMTEVFAPVQALQTARKSVARWMKPEKRKAPAPFNVFGAKAEVQYQPLGVVGIMGAWNAPLNLVIAPLVTVLAAGNRAMLCPSDMMPESALALDVAVREYFDADELAVAYGGIEVSKAFSQLRFDHLMFTGSPNVGALVNAAAAPNLVPVTLELGGKCPTIIGPDANVKEFAQRVAVAKSMNGGQACLAPDLLFVPRAKIDRFVAEMDRKLRQLFPAGARDAFYCGLSAPRYFQRLESIIEEARAAGARIISVGADAAALKDESNNRLALHLIVDPPANTRAATEELFGPVTVLRPYDDIDDVCRQLRQMEKPLGLYVFSKNAKFRQHVLDRTFSGGVTLNDAMMHYSVPDLPFGGVGRSGIGAYSYGIEGFKRFSHARSVYTQAGPQALMRVMLPPYGKLFDMAVRGSLDKWVRKYAAIKPRNS